MKKIILIGVFLTAYCLSYSQWISIGGESSVSSDGSLGLKGDSAFVMKNTEQVYDSIAFASTINLDLTTGADYVIIGITGNCTINISDLLGGESMIILYMDGTGGHTVTLGTGFTDKEGEGTINTTASGRTVIQIEHVVGPGGFEDTFYMIL